jgi:diamine N-acetyltransferase
LKKIDTTNWQDAIRLKVRADQQNFVSPNATSLAKGYIQPYGPDSKFTPLGIYDGTKMVGYVMLVCDVATKDDYWIDDIMIDQQYQGRGYGRAAMAEVIRYFLTNFSGCRAICLTFHRDNRVAESLYRKMGFENSGRIHKENGEPIYQLAGAALESFLAESKRAG